jgi:hypothetical protein
MVSERRVTGRILAQLFGSLLDPKMSDTGQEVRRGDVDLTKAFVFHIQRTKVFVYHGAFSAEFIQEIQSGKKVAEASIIHRYPKDGFDLGDVQQRKDLFMAMLKLLRYSASGQAKLSPLNQGSTQVKV